MDLVHVTNSGRGARILQAGKIEARPCKIFNTQLVYTFLARPAFRLSNGDEKSDQISRFPFAFIISPALLDKPYHIYPFDTGAAVSGRFGPTADPEVYLEEYELEPTLDSALRHIAWAFTDRTAYFEGVLRSGLSDTLPYWESVGRGWITIANLSGDGEDRPDQRSSAIEVAYKKDIDLKDNVILIILPQQMIEDNRRDNHKILNILNKLGIRHAFYDWRPNETPNSFMIEIDRIVRQHLEFEGQL